MCKKMKMIKNIFVISFLGIVFASPSFAGTKSVAGQKSYWGNPSQVTCPASFNTGDAIIGTQKDICTGNNNAACKLGNDYGALMLVAREVKQYGAQFCVTTVVGDNKKKGNAWTLYYDSSKGEKCFWLCKPGYSASSQCSSKATSCDSTLIKRSNYDSYAIARVTNVEDKIAMFYMNNYQKCARNTKHEHDMILGITEWTTSGHGAFAQPVVVQAWRGDWKSTTGWPRISLAGTKTLLCKDGYKANSAGTDCVRDEAICKTETNATIEAQKDNSCSGWEMSGLDETKYELKKVGNCYQYRCSEPGTGFTSASVRTCVECTGDGRVGVSDDTGACVKCATGKVFSNTAASSGYCKDVKKQLATTDLQYGLGQSQNIEFKDQCWTLTDMDEYKDCVMGAASSASQSALKTSVLQSSLNTYVVK